MMMSGNMLMEENFRSSILNPVDGNRIYASINASTSKKLGKANINIKSGLYGLSYDLNNDVQTDSVLVPKTEITFQYISSKKTKKGMRTITPKMMLGYSGYENQSKNPIFDTYEITPNNIIFSNSRYTGMDRIGDQKFVSIGLNLMSMNMSMDKLMFFLGKKIYFEDPKNRIGAMSPNTKNNSPIVFMTNYKTNNNFNFRLYTGLRSKDERVLLGGADISKKYKKMSVSYSKRYRRMAGSFGETLDYSELKGQININSKIKLYAQIKQDDKQKKIIENTIGVEYEDCCYKFRLVGKDRDYSNFNVYNNNNNYQYLQDAFRDLIQIQSKGSISFEFELKVLILPLIKLVDCLIIHYQITEYMKILKNLLIIVLTLNVYAEVQVLDRIAVIVDDGIIMESQIKSKLLISLSNTKIKILRLHLMKFLEKR